MKEKHVSGESMEAFLAGELDGDQLKFVNDHLQDCSACEAERQKCKKENEDFQIIAADEKEFVDEAKNKELAGHLVICLNRGSSKKIILGWEDRVVRSRRFWSAIAAAVLIGLLLPYWPVGSGAPDINTSGLKLEEGRRKNIESNLGGDGGDLKIAEVIKRNAKLENYFPEKEPLKGRNVLKEREQWLKNL